MTFLLSFTGNCPAGTATDDHDFSKEDGVVLSFLSSMKEQLIIAAPLNAMTNIGVHCPRSIVAFGKTAVSREQNCPWQLSQQGRYPSDKCTLP